MTVHKNRAYHPEGKVIAGYAERWTGTCFWSKDRKFEFKFAIIEMLNVVC